MNHELLLLFLVFVSVYLMKSNFRIFSFLENFEDSSEYEACRDNGHTKEFCLENPKHPVNCNCDNGKLGCKAKGFKGDCVCPCPEEKNDKLIIEPTPAKQEVTGISSGNDYYSPP